MGFDLGSIFDMFGGGGGDSQDVIETQRNIERMPDYPEATGAREEMYSRLQGWGGQEGYGAISPNWDEIWGDAEKKVKQYYWGSPTDPGVVGKMKADAAKKGQTDQPEYLRSLAKMGATESDQLSSMAIKQAMEQAGFAEKGRQNWMTEMNFMMGLKPQYMETGRTTSKYLEGDNIGSGSGGMDWNVFGDVLNQTGTGQSGGGNWWNDLMGGGQGQGQGRGQATIDGGYDDSGKYDASQSDNAWRFGY